jgi:hypothetical protein
MKKAQIFIIIFLLISGLNTFAQNRIKLIEKTELINTEKSFNCKEHYIEHEGEKQLYFEFSAFEEEFVLRLYPSGRYKNYKFNIVSTTDYEIIDSVFFIDEEYYQTKIIFKRIIDNPRLSIKISALAEDGKVYINEIPLFPVAVMECDFVSIPEDIFIGEESLLEIFTNLPQNIVVSSKWNSTGNFNYRVLRRRNNLLVNLIVTKTGREEMDLYLKLKRPIFDKAGELQYKYVPLNINLNVKGSRLAFINSSEKEIVFDLETREQGVEIQVDYHAQLKMQTTYRIEAQEEAGGALIAELFTKSRLANNKVLCVLRTYNYHNQSDGFLYLKEGDAAKFITNFSVVPHTNIEKIKIMRDASAWQETNIVYPGEDLLIRLEGQSLQRASFTIEDLIIESGDTLINRDNILEFRASVPINIRRRTLQIMDKGIPTGKNLNVREYSKFRSYDYILVDYGAGEKYIDMISGPQFHSKTIQDIVISFDHDLIDDEMFHGVQNFDLDIRITGSKGEVYEVLSLKNNVVVPGALSPRFAYYDRKNAVSRINLNQYLRRKTYDLEDWVKIELVFKPTDTKNTGRDDIKTIDIIVQRDFRFDIDVSFPAGLITKKFDGESGYGNLSGISMAMIAQFSFYQKDKIARFKPYKIGAGFIAINALNFSETAKRDMGIVVIGSLYPTTRSTRMTFPLYFGGGYLLNDAKMFVLLGPGIRVSL